MRIIFHIGTKKTGTSSIQNYLTINKDVLRKKGLCFPELAGEMKHAQLVFACLKEKHMERFIIKNRKYDSVRKCLEVIDNQIQTDTQVLLISTELFSLYPPALFRDIFSYYDQYPCSFIIYLREQNSYLASEYGQQIIHGRSSASFEEFDLNYFTEHDFLDYYELLESWARVVGKENIIVRPFERGQLDDDLVKDFFMSAGIEDFYEKQEVPFINESFSFDAIRFFQLANRYFTRIKLRPELIDMIENYFSSPLKSSAFLTDEFIAKISQKYQKSNLLVAQSYLNKENDTLFHKIAISPKRDEQQSSFNEEKLIKLFIDHWHKEEFMKVKDSHKMEDRKNNNLVFKHLDLLLEKNPDIIGIGTIDSLNLLASDLKQYFGKKKYNFTRIGTDTKKDTPGKVVEAAAKKTNKNNRIVFLTDTNLSDILYCHRIASPFKDRESVVVSCYGRTLFTEEVKGAWWPMSYERMFFTTSQWLQSPAHSSLSDEGDYIEFGVSDGKTMSLAYQTMKKIKNLRFFGFDSFTGIRGTSNNENTIYSDGSYYSNMKTFLHNMKIIAPDSDRIIPVRGDFRDNVKQKEILYEKFSLRRCLVAHIDCDVYEAAKAALDFIAPLLVQGSILLFDEYQAYNASNDKGERRALREWLSENEKIEVEPWYDYALCAKSFIVHVKS